MQFNIESFRQNLTKHKETARADKFDVQLVIPASIANGASAQELSLQCESSELPSLDINMIEYRHYGFIRRIPHYNQYGQASFTFIVTGDMWEKLLFDRWMDSMIPAATGLVSYAQDIFGNQAYETTIKCNQYDTKGTLIYTAELNEAVPISMSALNQSWDNEAIHKLVVNFAFRKWSSNGSTKGTSLDANAIINNAINNYNNQVSNILSKFPQ